MRPAGKELIWSSRALMAIGLMSLTQADEMGPLWLLMGWMSWLTGWFLDQWPDTQARLRRLETLAVIGLVSYTLIDFFAFQNTIFITLSHFLLLFALFKALGPKERKDCIQIGVIGFFQLLAACTLSADTGQALLLVALIPALIALLYWGLVERIRETTHIMNWPVTPLRQLHRWITVATVPLILIMTAVTFTVFPRLSFNLQVPGLGAGQSAYTDDIQLDRGGTTGLSETPAVWIRFANGENKKQWSGYLRGEVLDSFDGRRWSNSRTDRLRRWSADRNQVFQISAATADERSIRHTITILNTSINTLFMPGTPLRIIAPVNVLQQSSAGHWQWLASLSKPLQFDVYATAASAVSFSADPPDSRYRELPPLNWGRVSELARVESGNGSVLERAQRLETYLRQTGRYSLNNTSTGNNPVDEFLFDERRGSCGHFASALAVLLRLQGIPSRLVAGYHGGEWNVPAEQIVLRQKHAHAWVEAWTGDRWARLDPTPLPADLDGEGVSMWERAQLRTRQYWDYAGYLWNRFIVEYDMQSQWRALSRLNDRAKGNGFSLNSRFDNRASRTRRSEESRRNVIAPIIGTLFLIGSLMGIISLWRRRHKQPSAIPADYIRFLRRMERAGLPRQPWETAHEFSRRARQRFPEQTNQIERITSAYIKQRYSL